MKRRALALCTGLLLLGLAPGWALASTFTVDQSNPNFDHYVQNSFIDAQTFTAGMYGPLESVDLFLEGIPGGSVYVSVQGTTGSPPVPNGTVLASTTLGVHSPSGGWVRFDFSTNPIVTPGHVYAIVFLPTDNVTVFGSKMNLYPRGRALEFSAGAWVATVFPSSDSDFAFQTNVGLAAPTPTPTHAPTHAPAAPPTATPTPTPTATASATLTPTPAPTDSPTATEVSTAAVTPPAPGSGSGSGSGSSGSTDMTIPIVGAGIVLLVLLAGGLGLMLGRRRQTRG
jgi:hypothetical protein